MPRRRSGADSLLGIALVIGLGVWMVSKLLDSIGVAGIIAAICLIVGLTIWYRHSKRQARLAYLRGKFGDEQIVQAIMAGRLWEGQTAEQLRESLGRAAAVDDNLLKTRKREVWKYEPSGVNRYKLRITLDNDVVVGWDHKK
jgi:hypothetical protein